MDDVDLLHVSIFLLSCQCGPFFQRLGSTHWGVNLCPFDTHDASYFFPANPGH